MGWTEPTRFTNTSLPNSEVLNQQLSDNHEYLKHPTRDIQTLQDITINPTGSFTVIHPELILKVDTVGISDLFVWLLVPHRGDGTVLNSVLDVDFLLDDSVYVSNFTSTPSTNGTFRHGQRNSNTVQLTSQIVRLFPNVRAGSHVIKPMVKFSNGTSYIIGGTGTLIQAGVIVQ